MSNFIHEPVLSGALPANAEDALTCSPGSDVLSSYPQQFAADLTCTPNASPSDRGTTCAVTPAGNGSFSQNVQRLGVYAEDSWRVTPQLTVNYGLRYDRSFGLFIASGQSQLQNPAYLTMKALQVPMFSGENGERRTTTVGRWGRGSGSCTRRGNRRTR